jgi:hypothetical protein
MHSIFSGDAKDATKLFEKYHTWVNPAFMLERCFLGYLEDDPNSTSGHSSDEDGDGEGEGGRNRSNP